MLKVKLTKEDTMTDHLRPFDGQSLTYTLRELHPAGAEYQSQFHDPDAAALAFVRACAQAQSAELRDHDGEIVAAYAGGGAA